MKQRQHLGRPVAPVLVRQFARFATLLPTITSYRLGLERTGFILSPDSKSKLRPFHVGALDQLFFASASTSTTVTTSPFLRLRFEVPVSHQLRVRGQLKPASSMTARIV